MVMESRQRTVAAFHRRGGTLKGLDLLCGPRAPVLQRQRRKPLRERMLVQRRSHRLPYQS